MTILVSGAEIQKKWDFEHLVSLEPQHFRKSQNDVAQNL